jgi:hypothetical protein
VSRFGDSENPCDAQYAGPHRKTRRLGSGSTAGSVVRDRTRRRRGCFCISFAARPRLRIGLEVRPSFSISLNERDLDLLEDLQAFFGCGWIRRSVSDRTYKYEVRSICDLNGVILPHFERFPLRGCKARSCAGFSAVCRMIAQGDHLQRMGMKEIVERSYGLNPGTRRYSRAALLRVLDEVKV